MKLYAYLILTVTVAASAFTALKLHDQKVVTQERARVEAKGKVTDAKAQTARRAAAAKPDGVLARYFRD